MKPSRGDPVTGKPELETNTPLGLKRLELEAEALPKEPVELSSRDTARVELPSNIPQAELPGEDVVGYSVEKDGGESGQRESPHRDHVGGGMVS